MKASEISTAAKIANVLDETQAAWLSHESQCLSHEVAKKLVGLGVVEVEAEGRACELTYTTRTELGKAASTVLEARRLAMTMGEFFRDALGQASLFSTETTRALTTTPLFELRKSGEAFVVRRTALGQSVNEWLVAEAARARTP